MGSHFFPGTPHTLSERSVRSVLAFGATGVDLFFVLSGFLISGILYDSLQDDHFFRKFYARRALRILPLYYGVIAVYAIVGLLQHRSSHGELLSLTLYLQNTSLIAQPIFYYTGPLLLPLGHFWSLAIEEQFYLVWPLLVFLLRTSTRLLIFCFALILLCPVLRYFPLSHEVPFFFVHASTIYRADSLVAGGALSFFLRTRWRDKVLSLGGWLFLAVPLMLFCSSFGSLSIFATAQKRAVLEASSYSLLALGYTGLLILSIGRSGWQRAFSSRPMRFLGKYSYGLYVLHLILLAYIEHPLHDSLRSMNVNKGLAVVIVGVICFASSIAAAVLSYQLYERHFLRLKRFFDYRPHRPAGMPAELPSSSFNTTAADTYTHTCKRSAG